MAGDAPDSTRPDRPISPDLKAMDAVPHSLLTRITRPVYRVKITVPIDLLPHFGDVDLSAVRGCIVANDIPLIAGKPLDKITQLAVKAAVVPTPGLRVVREWELSNVELVRETPAGEVVALKVEMTRPKGTPKEITGWAIVECVGVEKMGGTEEVELLCKAVYAAEFGGRFFVENELYFGDV